MTNLTISLSDEIVQKLRQTVKERYGNRKGAISGLIEESLKERIDALQSSKASQTFRALKDNNTVVAEAVNLKNLVVKLKQKGIDPRSVRIESSRGLPSRARLGPRR
jgi:metal-responsive CopG/Arc/MetJ family transcriptional regulator